MLVLGITGGLARADQRDVFDLGPIMFHDSAAVLVNDGVIVAAVEEERLNRVKHTNKFPENAIRACLQQADASIEDIEHVAYYADEAALTVALRSHGLHRVSNGSGFGDALRATFVERMGGAPRTGIHFVRHHVAHAMSAFLPSGFDSSLIFTVDAMGERESALVMEGTRAAMRIHRSIPIAESLGFLYADLIRYIGFGYQEEYKVMGLAPHGDPGRFRSLFQSLYELGPEGTYALRRDSFASFRRGLFEIRARHDPITQQHCDFAAALQEALETIVLHVLGHFRRATGHARLCLAGGVAQNCSMNGKLMCSGLFDEIFVQPASHDAGCALGAALHVYATQRPGASLPKLEHVYLGRDLGGNGAVRDAIVRWSSFLEARPVADPARATAELLASGHIVGWAQGRAEFGPRALGNRSILADPRPAKNRDIINGMIKKRESFRPFAPAVLEERVDAYFELPPGLARSPFMTFVVKVRAEKRPLLGAVTHVDGTARVQTVSRAASARFWALIRCFEELTGTPIVLNTSFNNNFEPIVDSPDDAIACFLTSGLDYLVLDDHVVSRRSTPTAAYLDLVPTLPAHVSVAKHAHGAPDCARHELRSNVAGIDPAAISAEMADAISRADGVRQLRDLLGAHAEGALALEVATQALELWTKRLVRMAPPHRT